MKFFFICLIFFSHCQVSSQTFPEIEFQTFADLDGLSDVYCNKVVQDSKGFIWVGTKNGISRYDGTRFKSFTGFFKGNKITKLGNIYNVLPLENGGIYIGSFNQLLYFNTNNELFYNIGKKGGSVYCEQQKTMLKLTDNYYELPKEVNKDFPKLKPVLKTKNDCNKYYSLIVDRNGVFWSWGGDFLCKIEKKSKKIVEKFDFKNLSGKGFQKLYFDNKNRLWVSTWGNGVFIFNPKTKELERVETVYNNEFVALGFTNWRHQGRNYIVVLGDASLVLIDEETLNVRMYEDKEGRFRVFDALQDKQGNLWLATEYGLKFINSKPNFFKVIPIKSSQMSENNFQKAVTRIYEDDACFIVAKRWFDGIYIYDKNWNLQNRISQFENKFSKQIDQNSSEIFGIISSGDNKYFTSYFGLYKLKKNEEIKKIIPPINNKGKELLLEEIIVETSSVWWIKYKNGILKFNPLKDEFSDNFDLNFNKSKKFNVFSIILTRNKKLLVSTTRGIFLFNKLKNDFQRISIKNLNDEALYSMCEDSREKIWAINENGIFVINLNTNNIIQRSIPELKINYKKKLCVDINNNIWFHTNEGYWCFIQKDNEIAKFAYKNGLPDNKLESFSMEMVNGKDGCVYAGARDAVIRFDLEKIRKYQSENKVLITDIEANGIRFNSNKKKDDSEELILPAGNYLFNLSFSVPDYCASRNYELFYTISSNNKKWIKSEDGTIRFSNLSKGNYVISLRGKNNLTGKFTSIKIIRVFVTSFWYQSWWFYGFVFLGSGFIVWGVTRYVWLQRLKDQNYERKIKESEMQTLRSQMNPHFMFNTLNAINNFIVKNNIDSASNYLGMFSKLMRNILENSKQEFITLENELKTLKMYLKLEQVRLNNAFDFEISLADTMNEENIKVPPLILQPYCENAIWHGLRNKNGHGLLKINIIQSSKNQFQLIIEDDGIGRTESAKLKKNETEHKSYGMQITEQRLHMINPENSVKIVDLYDENGLAKGTRIIINLTEIE